MSEIEQINSHDNKEETNEDKSNIKKEILDWLKTIFLYCIIPVTLFEIFCFIATVPTESMDTTIPVGGRLIVTRSWYDKKINYEDIVVFESEEFDKILIKRCIGLPGDVIEFVDGQLYRNGESIEEPYISTYDPYYGSFIVPKGCYFFCGDNRGGSNDARYWENPYINENKIMGKARVLFFPFKDFNIFSAD